MWFPNKALIYMSTPDELFRFLDWAETYGMTNFCGDPYHANWEPGMCLRVHGSIIKSFGEIGFYKGRGTKYQKDVEPEFLFCTPDFYMAAAAGCALGEDDVTVDLEDIL